MAACSHHQAASDQPKSLERDSTYCYIDDMSFPTVRTDRFLAPAVANDFAAGFFTMDGSSTQRLRIDGLLCTICVGSFGLAVRITEAAILYFGCVEVDLFWTIVERVDRVGLVAVTALQVESAGVLWLCVVVVKLQLIIVTGTRCQSDYGRSPQERKEREQGDES